MARRRILSAVLLAAALAAFPAGSAVGDRHGGPTPDAGTDPSTNSWSAHCPFTDQIAKIDPIVFYNDQPHPPTHVHIFFGNVLEDGVTSTTTPEQLRQAPLVQGEYTTCLGPHLRTPPPGACLTAPHVVCDKSAYWAPQLEDTSVADPDDPDSPDGWLPVPPAYALVYYRNELVPAGDVQVFGQNLSMVAGSAMAMERQPSWVVAWSCVQARNTTHLGVLMPATCRIGQVGEGQNPDVYLRMVITFPNCLLDGLHADEHGMLIPQPGQSAYTTDPQVGGHCARGFHAIPTIQVGVRWNLSQYLQRHRTGSTFDLRDLYVSSDFMGDPDPSHGTWVARGQTAHADFESGWTQELLNRLMLECFHSGPNNCGSIRGGGT